MIGFFRIFLDPHGHWIHDVDRIIWYRGFSRIPGYRVQAAVSSVDDKIRYAGFASPGSPVSRAALEAVREANVPSGLGGRITPSRIG